MAELSGATLVARSLKQQGVETMFGIVGFPVFGIAAAAQREGIQFVGMRNEQAASYAAGAVGYFTGRPGACLTVSGPGMIHGIAGLANAQENCWPMILLGGASNSYQEGMGAFQEAPQVELARIYSKYTARPDQASRIPFYCEQAVRTAINGRPGAVYLTGAITLPALRGRGVYRATIGARLELAAREGFRLATTHARCATSAPILERLGFETDFRYPLFAFPGGR